MIYEAAGYRLGVAAGIEFALRAGADREAICGQLHGLR